MTEARPQLTKEQILERRNELAQRRQEMLEEDPALPRKTNEIFAPILHGRFKMLQSKLPLTPDEEKELAQLQNRFEELGKDHPNEAVFWDVDQELVRLERDLLYLDPDGYRAGKYDTAE